MVGAFFIMGHSEHRVAIFPGPHYGSVECRVVYLPDLRLLAYFHRLFTACIRYLHLLVLECKRRSAGNGPCFGI